MSTNWKDIGKNSGNMQHYRNVKTNKLDYEKGKWNSIYDISGNKKKGYTFDICGENIVVGIGTGKPFSRLSLGSIENSGVFESTDPGQLAAIAVNETSSGGKFKGIIYDSKLANWENAGLTHNGLRILSTDKDSFDMTDISSGKIIIGSDNVVTIGGEPSQGNNDSGGNIRGKAIVDAYDGNSQIVLDVKGSLKTNGYINFYNFNNGTEKPDGNFWNKSGTSYENIPRGSLWISPGGGDDGTEGLYFKDSNDNAVYIDPTGGGGTSSTAGAFDASFSSVPPFIIQKAKVSSSQKSGGVNVKIDGAEKDTPEDGGNFNNLLTITSGNLAICGVSGELKAWPTAGSPLLSNNFIGNIQAGIPKATDISGGLLWVQRQLAIGPNKYDKNWSVIDVQTVQHAAALMSYNQLDPDQTTSAQMKPMKATNALILMNKKPQDDGNSQAIIGNKHDCSNSIIIGNSFTEINTPNSLISNMKITGSGSQTINDDKGYNIVFGANSLKYSPFTIMVGNNNTIDNSNNSTANDLTNGGGNLIMGNSNIIDNSGETMNNVNVVIGITNQVGSGEQNLILGTSNQNFGSHNILFGSNNTNGLKYQTTFDKEIGKDFSGNYSFIYGNNNKVFVPQNKTLEGVFIAGNNNTLDVSGSSYVNKDRGYVLLGSYAGISGENPASPHTAGSVIIEDLSNIKFAFGTEEMYNARNTTDKAKYGGNVFTVDASGNTRIYGNLIVDGSNVVFRTEYLDVSDNNLSLNYPGTTGPQEGGGITIMGPDPGGSDNKVFSWTATGPHSSDDCWDTNHSDISTNKIYATNVYGNDISCTDISCVDLSAQHVFFTGDMNVNTIHAMDISCANISCADISCQDISCQDISCQDISCVDISGLNGFFTGDLSCNGKLYVGGLIDPTGLVLEAQGTTCPDETAGKLCIWYDSTNNKLKYNTGTTSNFILSDTGTSPPAGSGMTSWIFSGNGTATDGIVTNGQTVILSPGDGISSTQDGTDKKKFTLAVDLAASGAGVGGLQITSNKLEVNFGTAAGTALEGNTTTISSTQASAISDNSAKVSMVIGANSNEAMAGDTTTISSTQASAISDNSAKVSMVIGANSNEAMAGNTLTQNSVTLGAAGSNFSFVRPTASAAGNQTLIEGQAGAVGGNAGGNIVLKAGAPTTGSTTFGDIKFQYNASDSFKFSSSGLDMDNKKINNVSDPTTAQDAATKAWVESQLSGGGGSGGTSATKLKVSTSVNTDNTARPIVFAASTGGFKDCSGTDDFTYNHNTGTVLAKVMTLSGTASASVLTITNGDLLLSNGEVKTAKISFTDGDDAITIADTGLCTFAQDVTFNGNIVADANEAKNIFALVTSNNITIGGSGSKTVVDALTVTQASTLTGDVTLGGDAAFTMKKPTHSSGAGTALNIIGQLAGANTNAGGAVSITGGAGLTSGAGGNITINGGAAPAGGNGGSITLTGGTSGSGTAGVVNIASTLQLSGTSVTATAAELNYLDITTLGTSEASKAVTADANGDVKIADGAYDFDIASHDGTNGLKLAGTLVTATAAELNYLDITTLGTSEASKAVTADANGDVKIADGAYDFDIASHDGTNGLKLAGTLVTATAAELNYLDITTLGTSEASKAVTADANGDVKIADGAYDFDIASHDGTNGLKLAGTLVTATAAELNYLDITTLGTSEASKAVTADANGDVKIADGAYDFDIASHDGTNGLKLAGTLVTATAAQINNLSYFRSNADTQISGGVITATETLHILQSQTGTSDDLSALASPVGSTGQVVYLQAMRSPASHTITVHHNESNPGAGNSKMWLSGGSDRILTGENHSVIQLIYDGTYWTEVSYSAGVAPP